MHYYCGVYFTAFVDSKSYRFYSRIIFENMFMDFNIEDKLPFDQVSVIGVEV